MPYAVRQAEHSAEEEICRYEQDAEKHYLPVKAVLSISEDLAELSLKQLVVKGEVASCDEHEYRTDPVHIGTVIVGNRQVMRHISGSTHRSEHDGEGIKQSKASQHQQDDLQKGNACIDQPQDKRSLFYLRSQLVLCRTD